MQIDAIELAKGIRKRILRITNKYPLGVNKKDLLQMEDAGKLKAYQEILNLLQGMTENGR